MAQQPSSCRLRSRFQLGTADRRTSLSSSARRGGASPVILVRAPHGRRRTPSNLLPVARAQTQSSLCSCSSRGATRSGDGGGCRRRLPHTSARRACHAPLPPSSPNHIFFSTDENLLHFPGRTGRCPSCRLRVGVTEAWQPGSGRQGVG